MFIGTALALIGAILLAVVIIILIFALLSGQPLIPHIVSSIVTSQKLKDNVDDECRNCMHYNDNGGCRLEECKFQKN